MARKRKKGCSMRKGSVFERKMCKMLSLWWTRGKRDDVFWRTSGSGARATTRSKQGKRTHGQYGDVQAVDSIGEPLTKLVVIELKCGYNKGSLADLVYRWDDEKPCLFEKFIRQAEKESAAREGRSNEEWILLVKQDYKEVILLTTQDIWESIVRLDTDYWIPGVLHFSRESNTIVAMTWKRFKKLVSRRRIIKWAANL